MAPMTGQAVSPSPFGLLAGGDGENGANDVQQQVGDTLGQLRDLMSQINDLVGANPALAQEGQQMGALVKQMIVKVAKQAPTMTASSEAVPQT